MYFEDVEIIVAAKHRVLGDDAAGCVSAVGDAGAVDWQFFDCMAANTCGIVPPVANLPRSENSGGGVAALQAIIASTSSRN